jgi:type II secretory pathway pseudopilin PulG
MRLLRSQKNQKAMTLIEIMVSLLLVSLLVGTVLVLLLQNMKIATTIDYSYAASNIARSRIDRIRQLRRDQGFSNLAAAAETNTTVDRNGTPDPEGDFARTTTITTNFGGNADVTKIEVTVSFKGPGGVNISTVTLTSLICPHL